MKVKRRISPGSNLVQRLLALALAVTGIKSLVRWLMTDPASHRHGAFRT